ncbi:WD40/YVTN repeat-like-containing domain protein [Akanthomyces lecanii RCEF 1005]|uniref:WD40/YVTN repeat-like-containing domain protein n=1 Tax=Akanthomyces lecanii RCEF 1005 TaxID=1081108 RepID=A0A168GIN0_CORDF|nr:WD40/YVTN repeat-like-containing domain protein [Akanthomyces lecanii RCEF 1005]
MKFSIIAPLLAGGALAAPTTDSNSNSHPSAAGAVFAMTNVASANQIVAFSRSSSGELTPAGTYATGGRGQGVDFDTQGGLQLSADRKFLYAVNPADDKVSVFGVHGANLTLIQTVYAGDQPLGIALSPKTGYAYVLDGSVASTGIFGFKVDGGDGKLQPLTNATIPLSTPIGVPGDVVFSPDGRALVVTNKVGSTLDVFAVDAASGHASPTPMTTIASSGVRPFAAAFFKDFLYVIESGLPSLKNAALSTYRFNGGAAPSLTAITKAERNDQTDGCWVVVTPDGKWAYTANFVSGSISSYGLDGNGTATLMNGAAALPGGEGSQPVDLVLSSDGRYLYNLLRGSGAVAGYEIQQDGSLKQIGGLVGKGMGLPAMDGASGLAGY